MEEVDAAVSLLTKLLLAHTNHQDILNNEKAILYYADHLDEIEN